MIFACLLIFITIIILKSDKYCEAQGKGRARGTQEGHSKVIYRWWMVDGGYPFPDALH